jgi:hypothetical protein
MSGTSETESTYTKETVSNSDGTTVKEAFTEKTSSTDQEKITAPPEEIVLLEPEVEVLLEPEPVRGVSKPTIKKRTLMGVIRASYMCLFGVAGEAITYAADNLTSLNLPPGTGLMIGAIAYGIKRAIKPDGLL